MSEKSHRIVLSIEATILSLPPTLMFAASGLGIFSFSLNKLNMASIIGFAGTNIYVAASLSCYWYLILSFVFRGKPSLDQASLYWWILPTLNTLVAFALTVYLLLPASEWKMSSFYYLASWIPFALPLLHLAAIRRRDKL